MGDGDFTLKEKLLEMQSEQKERFLAIHSELKDFRKDSLAADQDHDKRIKHLEGYKTSLVSNLKLAAWAIGIMISGGGILLAKFFIK